jgi:hypothetical protein
MACGVGSIPFPSSLEVPVLSHRFFHMDESPNISFCCGIVAKVAAIVLQKLAFANFFNSLDSQWVTSALISNTNQSVKGFAFESYALMHCISSFKTYVGDVFGFSMLPDNVSVVNFFKDYPSSGDLQSNNKVCFFGRRNGIVVILMVLSAGLRIATIL